MTTAKLKRGFALMTPERLAELTKKAGRASQTKDPVTGKTPGHRWTTERARAASQKAIAGRAKAKALRLAKPEGE